MQLINIMKALFFVWCLLNVFGLFIVYIFSDKHGISAVAAYVSIIQIFLKHNTTSEYIKHLIGIMALFPVLFFYTIFHYCVSNRVLVYWCIDIFDGKRKAYR